MTSCRKNTGHVAVGPVVELEKTAGQFPADRVEQLPGLDAGAAGRIEPGEPDRCGSRTVAVAEPAGEFQVSFTVADGRVKAVFVEDLAADVDELLRSSGGNRACG